MPTIRAEKALKRPASTAEMRRSVRAPYRIPRVIIERRKRFVRERVPSLNSA
jgi:hypothetical protein